MRFPQRPATGAVCRRLFATALAGSLLIACSDGTKPPANAGAPGAPGSVPMALPVGVISAQPTRVPMSIEAVAQAEGNREVQVRARVSGILEKRLYAEGQSVKAGQALFRIERAPYEIALAQAKAQLAEQQARAAQAAQQAQQAKQPQPSANPAAATAARPVGAPA